MMEGLKDVPTKVWVGAGIAVALLVILLLIRKDVLAWLNDEQPPLQSEEEVNTQVDDVLDTSDPTDASEPDENFGATALAIADSQYAELTSWSQDELAMMNQLQNYDGAQLQQIFEAFGARLYDGGIFGGPDTYMNLFQFYAAELDNSTVYGQAIDLDWSGLNEDWRPTDIPACDGLFEVCTEKQAMRAIWWRSGLPLTF